jgi:hypothetical protein
MDKMKYKCCGQEKTVYRQIQYPTGGYGVICGNTYEEIDKRIEEINKRLQEEGERKEKEEKKFSTPRLSLWGRIRKLFNM